MLVIQLCPGFSCSTQYLSVGVLHLSAEAPHPFAKAPCPFAEAPCPSDEVPRLFFAAQCSLDLFQYSYAESVPEEGKKT